MKKSVVLLIALAMILSFIPASFSLAATEIDRSEKVTLTYLYPLGGGFQVIDNLADNPVVKKANEVANVEIQFIHPPNGQEAEQFNLIIASDDLPDIITHGWGIPQLFPGGADRAIADGYYIPLNDLIDAYAPNFKAIMAEDDNVRKDVTTDEGYIWGMPMVDRTVQPQWTGPTVRKDILDELGLEIPETIDEWYHVLTTINENKDKYPNLIAPLMVDPNGHGDFHAFISAWGITDDFYQTDGEVKYGPVQPEYKDYLTEMNKWYAEGLIQKDFPEQYDRANSLMTDKTFTVATCGFWEFDSFKAGADDPDFYIVGVPYPSLVKGEKVHISYMARRSHLGYHTAVTTTCANPDRAVDWMDWWYSEEGSLLSNWGTEGEHWAYDDAGNRVYLPKIAQNEEGVSIPVIYFKYLWSHGAFLREWDRECGSYGVEANECQLTWLNSTESDWMIPTFTSLLPEESDEYSRIFNDINTYVGEMRVKFITGDEPLDKFDDFVAQIERMNLGRALEIKQAALDRFNKR